MIIYKNDWWVPSTDTQCLRSVLKDITTIDFFIPLVKNKKACIQAGGNFGIWPRKLSEIFEVVYTFEPESENWEAMQKNLNGITNVVAKKCALGSSTGTVSMDILHPGNSGAHQIKDGTDIEKINIDSLNLNNIGLIQFDIEGSEHEALLGSIDTIKRNWPVIVVELKGLGKRYGHSDEDTCKLLLDLGYKHVKTVKRDWIFVKPNLASLKHNQKTIQTCIPKNEVAIISPLSNYYGMPVSSLMEIGVKRNLNGSYKSDIESLGIRHLSVGVPTNGGEIFHDLSIPLWDIVGKFDMVTNFGVSEHFENQEMLWKNIHMCLNVGGVLVNETPHDGDWKGHGVWYPSFNFYEDFAKKNGYQIEKLYIEGKTPRRLILSRMYKKENKDFTMPDNYLLIHQQ